MRYTTRKLNDKQKQELLSKHKGLIKMIHCFGDMMTRSQIKTLYHILNPNIDTTTIEFDIVELILSGFLLQQKIQKPSNTQMLYLSKYPRSFFYTNKARTGDIPALVFSNNKIFHQIFKIDYIINIIIPSMRHEGFQIELDNILTYLCWKGTNLLLNPNQVNNYDFYNRLQYVSTNVGHTLSYDFIRDMEIAKYELAKFQSKPNQDVGICKEKVQRDLEKSSYSSEVEQNKYYYSLNNMFSQGFIFEGFDNINPNCIHLAYFDNSNSITTQKFIQNLGYILLMMNRYLNTNDIELICTLYTWDNQRVEKLQENESKKAFDFYLQETVEENKKEKILKDIGILPSYWNNIQCTYKSMDIFQKYNLRPNA